VVGYQHPYTGGGKKRKKEEKEEEKEEWQRERW